MKCHKIIFSLLFLSLLSSACQRSQEVSDKPLSVLNGEVILSEIALHRDAEANLLLSGGNGKYEVHVEDRSIATATIHHDTLRLRGHLEGETFAMIHSSGESFRLGVMVDHPELSMSHKEVLVYPDKDIKRSFVTLAGGDPKTTLTKEDPYDILTYKWNGANNLLEFYAYYEGNARIIATDSRGVQQTLDIKVRAEEDPTLIGVYNTNARYSNNPKFQARLCVEKQGGGIFLSKDATPYPCEIRRGYGMFGRVQKYGQEVYQISDLSTLKEGETKEIEVKKLHNVGTQLESGKHSLLVDKVHDGKVILLGNRYKILLPASPSSSW